MLKNIFLVFSLILIHLAAVSQKTNVWVNGAVYDEISGEPLEDANIRFQQSQTGTITDDLGGFSLTTQKLPSILVVSHIGYETKNISIKFTPLDDLVINLRQKSSGLSGVVITSQKIDTVFIDDEYAVLDYEVLDEGILLLVFKYNLLRSELLFTDFAGGELMELKVLPAKPLQLLKDCFGLLHVISKSKVFQISLDDDKIRLYDGVEIGKFNALMDGCEFEIKNKLYFSQKGFMELGRIFYYINTNDSQKHLLCSVFDEDKMDFFSQNPENAILFGATGPDLGDLRGLKGDLDIIGQMRFADTEAHFRKITFLSPAYLPIFRIGDSVAIFNHPASKIEFYGFQDSLVGSTPISYHIEENEHKGIIPVSAFKREGKWLKEVYVDHKWRKAYTLFMKSNGEQTIKEIDLETGELNTSILIPFPYVRKINVFDGHVYFIYKGWGSNQRNKLFRQGLD